MGRFRILRRNFRHVRLGRAFVHCLRSFYLGYGASIVGAIIGAVWAVVDGFFAGFVIAWIYNMVAK